MDCPLCGSHTTGRIGNNRYYCSECCHEWTDSLTGELKVYKILSDGSITQLIFNSRCLRQSKTAI